MMQKTLKRSYIDDMKKTRQYITPGYSPAILWLGRFLWPIYMRFVKRVTEFVVIEDGLESFASLRGKRVVICPNHASEDDPEVVFGLTRLVSEDFYYLTAHEIFHGHKGWNRFVLPEVGCYSVTRGTPDTHAYKTTRQLLVENKRKLVVFPEGEISHFNEVVLPMEPGVVRISYSAVHKLKVLGVDEDIMILPMAIMYNYTSDLRSKLASALAEIEKALGVSQSGALSLKERLHSDVLCLITSMESSNGLPEAQLPDFPSRAFALRERMILDVASKLNLQKSEHISQLEFAHALKSRLCDEFFHKQHIRGERRKLKVLYSQITTAIDLIAIEKSCVFDSARTSSQDELAEVTHLLEKVMFGKNAIYGKRRIMMQIGKPIALRDYREQFNLDEETATMRVNKSIRLELLSMLTRLATLRMEPIGTGRGRGRKYHHSTI